MRFAIPVLLITVLAAGPAMADRDHGGGGNGGGGGGGGGGKFKFAYLTVTNLHDDAVLVSASGAGGFGERSLEPNSSHTFVFMLSGGKTSDVIVTASLVSDSSVSTSHACTLQGNRTTSATVTSTVTAGAVSLAIECGDPSRVAAALTRNSAVMLASGSGLGFLLLVGSWGMLLSAFDRSRLPGRGERPFSDRFQHALANDVLHTFIDHFPLETSDAIRNLNCVVDSSGRRAGDGG